ncbi:AMP-binding protein [Nocardia sp. NBC_01327]|uniref:AMP-binding protein n=1 Tax=Nocardia sp. NBC_01327 TaxID=2903593 RepID=UPI002E15F624|nr:AMP-binding protein [Nocardia sp. NBC_01327]
MSEAAAASDPIITCGARTRRQSETHQRAGRLAAALADAGVGAGQRIAIMARNDIEFLEVSLAAATCGANPVPINTRWQAPEVAHILTDADVRMVFAHTEFVPIIEQAAKSAHVSPVIVEIAMPEGLTRETGVGRSPNQPTGRHAMFEEWIDAASEPLGWVEGAIADSMGLIYTSGTTGRPKGVLRQRMTPQQLLAIAGATAQRMGLTPGGQMLVAGPLYHTSPNAVALLALRMGTNITVMPRWNGEQFLKLVHQNRIQHAKIVPTMLSRLLSLPLDVRAHYDVTSLTHLIHSAAPCPPAVKRAAIDWFGAALWEFYGCSESGAITWTSSNDWLEHPGTVGRPLDGAAVVIFDERGTELPPRQIGRVFIKSADYWPDFDYLNQPSPNTTPRPGMITVGDLGYLDTDGYLYLTGRTSEVIIAGGVNIYPAEIEASISTLPHVEDVAVFGIPHPGDLGEQVAAHIITRPGAKLDETIIRTELVGQLADYKVPAVIRVVDELPRDDSGKIYKRQLRALYERR